MGKIAERTVGGGEDGLSGQRFELRGGSGRRKGGCKRGMGSREVGGQREGGGPMLRRRVFEDFREDICEQFRGGGGRGRLRGRTQFLLESG